MSEEIKHKPTSLYRAYAEGGELLYVGISLSVMARLSSHSSSSEWFKHAAFVDVAATNSFGVSRPLLTP